MKRRDSQGRRRPKRAGDPARAERLRRKLAELDRDIKQGTKNLVRATDNLDLIQEALTGLRADRERTARELEAAERDKGVPPEEMERRVDSAVERLAGLRDQLREVDRDRLRAVLSLLVSRVELYFDTPRPSKKGNRHWFVFAKGVVKLRPQIPLSGNGATG